MTVDEAKARMTEALKAARESWEEVGMPQVTTYATETGKIAIAIIAAKIYDEMDRQ